MIDLHTHVLPGVDDGAADLEQSLEMCRMAAAAGCEALVATPHQRREWPNQDREKLESRLASLREALPAALPDGIEVHLGAEIRADDQLLDELAREDRTGLLSLAGSRYLLIEFDGNRSEGELEEWIHELVVQGFTPIVAHPELSACLANQPHRLPRLVALGARSQITAMSVSGDFGRHVQRTAFDYLDQGLVHFLASDSHSPSWRPPGLDRAFQEVTRRWGDRTARNLVADHPRAVLEGRELPN